MKIQQKYGLGISTELELKPKKSKDLKKTITNDEYIKSNSNINITITKNSETIIETDSKADLDQEIKITAKPNTNSTITLLNTAGKITYVKKITLNAEKNSKITLITANIGAKQLLEETTSEINENADANILNLYRMKDQKYDIKSTSEHKEKNSNSLIKSKGVISNSEIINRGLVKINKDADNSNGYQKSDILQLKNSRAISIPDLEIHNQNVKCSHGSTISRIEEDQIFYMQSRGIKKEEAEKQIIKGFYESALKDIPEKTAQILKEHLL